MNHAALMRRLERLGDLFGDCQRFRQRQRAAGDSAGKRRAFDELHYQRGHAVGLLEAVDLRDVGMIQGCQQLRFAPESRNPIGIIGRGCKERFDRNRAVQARITSVIHLAHAAGAKQIDDLVAADARSDREGICHAVGSASHEPRRVASYRRNAEAVLRYSVLKATVGSILSARRVGTTHASMHTPNISAA